MLEYRPAGGKDLEPSSGELILSAFLDADAQIDYYVHPKWPRLIRARDEFYFVQLFRDLLLRSVQDSEGVFRQLSSLSVGPLVCRLSGSATAVQSALRAQCRDFIPLTEKEIPAGPKEEFPSACSVR